MPLSLDYNRGIQRLSNISPEVRAVPQYATLSANYGRAATQQGLSEANVGLNVRSMQENMRLERQNQAAANRDALTALGVTGVNTAAQLVVNRERIQAQKEAERRFNEEQDMWKATLEVMQSYWPQIEEKLRITQ